MSSNKHLDSKDYEKLGRLIEQVYLNGRYGKVLSSCFLRGLFYGFGAVLGGTLLIATLVYILSFFEGLPLIGDIIKKVQTIIESTP